MAEESIYGELSFPHPPAGRPYVFIDMAMSLDGKSTTQGRSKAVQDLGSPTDHKTLHHLESLADAVLLGAGTLRATPRINIPAGPIRICVTRSGSVDADHNFFADAPGESFLAMPAAALEEAPSSLPVIEAGAEELDFTVLLSVLKERHGVDLLMVEGGSTINGQLLSQDLVDEVFVTVCPKVALGKGPTIADWGELNVEPLRMFNLVSCTPFDDEVFLRYRRHR
jgi:riboflavin-specific deaminase-like protein